jgi:hypothetical protein
VIRHAKFATVRASRLRIFPLSAEKSKADDNAAAAWQEAFLQALNVKERERFLSVEINAPRARIYCVRDTTFLKDNLLICRVPGVQWGISFDGPAEEEQKAESLIASLRSSE